MHCNTAKGQWAMKLVQCMPALPGGRVTPATQCLTAWGQWAVLLLQCTASLPWGTGQCNSRNALPHCGSGQCNSSNTLAHRLAAVGSETPATRCQLPRGTGSPAQEAVATLIAELMQCTATLPRGSGQWNSCFA